MNRFRSSIFVAAILLCPTLMVATAASEASTYYTEPPMFGLRPDPNREGELGPVGVTGIEAHIYKGVKVTVENTQPNTPAHGKFSKGDVILGVNGTKLEGKNPLVVLGSALTQAEATDGILTFDIQPAKDSGPRQVAITIPVLGAYSKTFPLNCEKSKKVIQQAAAFYAGKDRMKEHTLFNGLECLFLLATGDDQYVPRVKEYFSQFLQPDGSLKGIDSMTWDNGYNGVACAEYYLRTGDRTLLPILQHYCDDAKHRQMYGIGWNHWSTGLRPAYEAGGGMIHSAGSQVLLTLLLGKACGVNVDDKTLLGALKHWYRFAGHGAIPVSDVRPWPFFRSGGRDGTTAAIMHVASQAKGDVTIYKRAKEYFAMSAITSWPSREYSWEAIWESLATPYMLEYNPELYYQTQQRFRWQYDLYRLPSGAFYYHCDHASLDVIDEGIALALDFVAPLKTLYITGAGSKHAKEFTLPEQLWGNEADLAFLSSKHNPDFYKYGTDEAIDIPYWTIPTTRMRYDEAIVKALPLEVMLKNVRHARFEMRVAAARALCINRRIGELEALLRDPDPRLRRAGLDGINDYSPWFLGPVVGKQALKADEYTPALQEAITAMMSNPKEAWYVIDGALQALSHGPIELIKKNLPAILPWAAHEDTWLHESAFTALMGLREDEEAFTKQLPVMINLMVKEYRYNPHYQMVKQLSDALAKYKNDSPVGKLIIAGFTQAAMKVRIEPDVGGFPRSNEGMANLIESALASVRQAPEAAAELAEVLAKSGRLDALDTANLMRLVRDKDGNLEDRFVGLYPALEKLSAGPKERLADVLYNTFRPELIKRYGAAKGQADEDLIDMILDLTRIKTPVAGWQPIGTPPPAERLWRYVSFDPTREADKLNPRDSHPFRDVALPAGMEKWYEPEFDDSHWKSGRTPIGVGVFRAYGHGNGWTATPEFSFKNNSDWGDGEFLLMRTTFDLKDLDCDFYRISILAVQGYHIYLNGHKIHTYEWFTDFPRYTHILLGEDQSRYLKKGANTVAIYCNLMYYKDPKKDSEAHPIGQIDLLFEGLKKKLSLLAINGRAASDAPIGIERVARPTTRNYITPALTNNDGACWVQVDLGRPVPIDKVKLFPHIDWGWLGENKTKFFPRRFKIEASDDPEFKTGSVITDQTGADFPNTEDAVIIFPGNSKAGRYVRLTATRLSDQKLALMKFEVWSGGKNVAEGCPAADSFKGNLGVTNLTLKRRPQDDVVTDNPGNVIPVEQWKPVAYKAQTPLGGVHLADGLFKTAMQNNIAYLMKTFTVDELVRDFRTRAGKPNPQGMRKPDHFWDTKLAGQNAGRFLMGAGNTLRWMEDPALRKRMNEIVDVIEECRQPDGYLMAYPPDTIFGSERAAYTRAWVTHGLIEAGYAGNPKAFPLLRGFYDWFNRSPYLPELLRRPVQGQQGTVANTRVYFTPIGKPEDLQVVQRYFQENYWLDQLARRDPDAIWKYPYDHPHCYLITAIEPYLDLYRATGKRDYLEAAMGGWDLYHENWEHIGGSIAICEGGSYPPKSNIFHCTGELCGSVFMARLSQRFHLLFPDQEKYVGEIEKAIYNVTLPNQVGDKGIRYHASMVGHKNDPSTIGTCCEGQGTRMIGSLPEYIYSIAPDGIYVDLFVPSDISWRQNKQTLKVQMATGFPFDNKVALRFSLTTAAAEKVRVRVPSWSVKPMEILVNNKLEVTGAPGAYAVLDRTWNDGDTITFTLSAELRMTKYTGREASDAQPRYAMEYGPILMATVGSRADSPEARFACDSSTLLNRIKPKAHEPLHFTIEGEPNYSYIPYWEVASKQTFTCFPVVAENQSPRPSFK